MLRRRILQVLLVLACVTAASYALFARGRTDWRVGVEPGNSDAYFAAFDAHYGPAARTFEYGLGATLLMASVAALLLVRRVRSWDDLRALSSKGRGRAHAAASLAVIALGVGTLAQMVHDMEMWRPPPWADSPGIVIYGAVTAMPVLLLVVNVVLGVYMLAGRFPSPIGSKATGGLQKVLSGVGWLGAGACATLALLCIAGSAPYLVPSFVLCGWAALLARAGVAERPAS